MSIILRELLNIKTKYKSTSNSPIQSTAIPHWPPKHNLDILLLLTTVKMYETATFTSYGPVLHCYK